MFQASSQMLPPTSIAGVAAPKSSRNWTGPTCPKCHSGVDRIPRRYIDRIMSLVYPLHRYRCPAPRCAWEGNLSCRSEPERNDALTTYSHRRDSEPPREGDTLPAQPSSGATHAGAGSHDDPPLTQRPERGKQATSR